MTLRIITPTLGRSPFLAETINCLKVPELRIKHVISCPRDCVKVLQERFPGSIVVEDQGSQGGIYGAINAGLSAAREPWDFFTYLNDDDLLGRDFGAMFKHHAVPANRNTVAFGCISHIDKEGRQLMPMTVGPNPRSIPCSPANGH